MALLDGVAWEGKVFKGGAWTDGRGGTYAVVEPATGKELGTMGQADADDRRCGIARRDGALDARSSAMYPTAGTRASMGA